VVDEAQPRPPRALLAICLAAGKILLLAAFLPAFRSCDHDSYPFQSVADPAFLFLLPPHVFGAGVALACALWLHRWEERRIVLEVTLVVLVLLSALALAAFFVFGVAKHGGVLLAMPVAVVPVLLLRRSPSWRWRAAGAVWLGAATCAIWYGFWIVVFSVDQSGDGILWGTYVAAGACAVLFVAGRQVQRAIPRWR
jgi:hypothetical protein